MFNIFFSFFAWNDSKQENGVAERTNGLAKHTCPATLKTEITSSNTGTRGF